MSKLGRWMGVAMVTAACACANGGTEDTASGIAFHGEGKLLDGFSFNTGPQPPTGPANVSLRLSGSGLVKVDARAHVEGGALVGNAGSGQVAIDAHVKLDGTLKIDSPIKKSSGDIPGLADIDIAITGSAPFDPFLLEGGSAEVSADVPETKLPDVPLGSVPGKLQLTVVSGSKLTTKYTATCMTIASGQAQYAGSAATSGTLKIKGTIVLDLPAPLNKSIDLPEITVPIPSATSEVKFESVATDGAGDSTTGSCSPVTGGDAGDDVGDGGVSDSSEPDADFDSSTEDSSLGSDASDASDGTVDGDGGPVSCSGEEPEPNDTVSTARALGTINDCDGSAKTFSGVLSHEMDLDVYTFDGDDTFGCSVNPYAKATGPAWICLKPVCKSGTTTYKGCTKGTRNVDECCGTEVEADFNCSGTTSESAKVTLRVSSTATLLTCGAYSILYHY